LADDRINRPTHRYYRGEVISSDDLVATYLGALSNSDAGLILSLFTDDAMVYSPLYGPSPAAEFYPALFADTTESHLTLKSVMQGVDEEGETTVSFWFHFDWRLPSGKAAPFDVVDIAKVGPEGKIQELRIIYDTVEVRPVFEAEVGRPSWRRGN
jgi:hypothetical protein